MQYEIVDREEQSGQSILLVRYAGCTTFGGLKLLLLKRRWEGGRVPLDPHLLGIDHIVAARFEPTAQGWRMARAAAYASVEEPRRVWYGPVNPNKHGPDH